MTSNKFIIKTWGKGVKVLTINDLKSNLYSLEHLLDNIDGENKLDSLAL
jgi:bifunctional DNase/RNase